MLRSLKRNHEAATFIALRLETKSAKERTDSENV